MAFYSQGMRVLTWLHGSVEAWPRCKGSTTWTDERSRVRLELGHGSFEDVAGDSDQATELTFVQRVILRERGNPIAWLAGER